VDSSAARIAGAQFEGLLLEQLFKPLAAAFGEYGDVFVGALSQRVAAGDRNGFGSLLTQLLARNVRSPG
jgi:hypothetical protein